jgi:prepilin-type N-terminal cleavage/methylation domain-containing protein
MVTKNGENLLFEKEFYTNKGVSLIEMLTAVAIFAITVGAISGLFISAIRSQRRVLATQELLDQTSYVMEYMGRALRMAKKELNASTCLSAYGLNYEIATIPGTGKNGLKFINYYGICQGFFLDNDVDGDGDDDQLKEWIEGQTPLPITSDKLDIENLQFNLSGKAQPPADYLQPRVTIFLEMWGRETIGMERPKIQIQTSISQRNLDVPY